MYNKFVWNIFHITDCKNDVVYTEYTQLFGLYYFVLLIFWIEVEPLESWCLGHLGVDLLQTVFHNVERQLSVRLQLSHGSSVVFFAGPEVGIQSVLSAQSNESDERSDVPLIGCDQVLVVCFSVSSANDDWRIASLHHKDKVNTGTEHVQTQV